MTGRQILTRLRGGCAGLRVELGRRCGEGREGRICQLCERAQEDEIHFALDCPALLAERREWFAKLDELVKEGRTEMVKKVKINKKVLERLGEARKMEERKREEKMAVLFGKGIPGWKEREAMQATMRFARMAMKKRRKTLMKKIV